MLNPAGLRENLTEFLLGGGADVACMVKKDAAGTGGTLIQGHDIFHIDFSFSICHDAKQDGDSRPFLSIYQTSGKVSSKGDGKGF
jgi:hypothetical protein